jgi:hypothetical protein
LEYFREKEGAYIFAGGSLGTARKVVTFSMLISMLAIISVSLFLWFSVRNSAGKVDPIAPLIPVFTLPGTMAALFFVRKRMDGLGTIRVDYMGGKVIFGLLSSGTMSRKEVQTASIRSIMLSRTASGHRGVGMETADGSFHLVTLRDPDLAAGMARELSGLISVPFIDRQD